MTGPEGTPHRLVNPEALAAPVGFAHAVAAAEGRVVFLGGQTGDRTDGTLAGDDLVTQFDQAAANVVEALRGAGGRPEHLVQILIFTTDMAAYRRSRQDIGVAYRKHLGKHYPAMALLGVTELFDPGAKVEVVGTAIIPQ